jgi:hypothetical protein
MFKKGRKKSFLNIRIVIRTYIQVYIRNFAFQVRFVSSINQQTSLCNNSEENRTHTVHTTCELKIELHFCFLFVDGFSCSPFVDHLFDQNEKLAYYFFVIIFFCQTMSTEKKNLDRAEIQSRNITRVFGKPGLSKFFSILGLM